MRYSSRAQAAIQLANQEAARLNYDHISTGHLLLGLMRLGEGAAIAFLKSTNVNMEKLKAELENSMENKGRGSLIGQLRFTSRANDALKIAAEESQNMGHKYTGTEHLLIGIIRERDGVASRILNKFGIDLDKARDAARAVSLDEEEHFETITFHNAKMTIPVREHLPAVSENEVLDMEDASRLLEITVDEMEKLLKEEDLPARMIGGQWRFSRSALIRWLGEGRSKSYVKP